MEQLPNLVLSGVTVCRSSVRTLRFGSVIPSVFGRVALTFFFSFVRFLSCYLFHIPYFAFYYYMFVHFLISMSMSIVNVT